MNEPVVILTLMIVLPGLGGAVAMLVNGKWSGYMGTSVSALTLVLSLMLAFRTVDDALLVPFSWLPDIEFGWYIDRLSALLIVLVSFVSFMVHLFSIKYMEHEEDKSRYFALLGLFATSMIGLLAADHLFVVFIFWELVGFSSYLLIGFWFIEEKNAFAARIAFITNRIADVGFLIAILLLWSTNNGLMLSGLTSELSGPWTMIIGFGLLLGAMGKSAQFPFYTWLPRAMSGPTPVSALIHAATMVAAGVYLLVRTEVLFNEVVLIVATVIGAITASIGAFSALIQNDIKGVLAYSTISQLGFMVMGVGVGAHEMAAFHLWTHAFFKAGLFLSAGAVIHYMHEHNQEADGQDMLAMGGLRSVMPITSMVFGICALALAGVPLFTGFLSKEGILIGTVQWAINYGAFAWLIPVAAFGAATMTAFYMGRQWLLIFTGQHRSGSHLVKKESAYMTIPLVLLAMGSVGIWYSFNPISHEIGWLSYVFQSYVHESFGYERFITAVSIALAITGLGIAYYFYRPNAVVSMFAHANPGWWSRLSVNSFYLDQIYHKYLTQLTHFSSLQVAKIDQHIINPAVDWLSMGVVVFSKGIDLIDKLFVDGFVNLVAWFSNAVGNILKFYQSSRVQMHFFWIAMGAILILIWINLV
ncbi:MAG: NADH-quinone oxidoreductase subunit L [Cyclobacteriaceae bacterium]